MIVKQRLKPQNKTVRYQPMSGRSFTDYAERISTYVIEKDILKKASALFAKEMK